jgi:molybdopterin-binding protein
MVDDGGTGTDAPRPRLSCAMRTPLPRYRIGAVCAVQLWLHIGGAVVTASITNEAAEELNLAAGRAVYAVIKASNGILTSYTADCNDFRHMR